MKRYRDAGADEVVLLLSRFQTAGEARGVVERLGERIIRPAGML